MGIVWIILIGIAAGFLAGLIMKGGGFGWIINLLLGIAGALIGGWLLGVLGVNLGEGIIGSLITATIGAVLLIFVVSLFKKKK
ncbi:MAG: GlsB/YeaQ/YmgE family stress response membrane protein [Bacteroidota bacterium]